MIRRPCVLAALFVAGFVGTAQAQTTWYVDDDAPNDPGPGDPTVSDPDENGTPEHPFDAIQEGIMACQHGDTVLVLDGTYAGDRNKNLDLGGLAIRVRSEHGPQTCIINCGSSGRGFLFRFGEGPDSVVDGFAIKYGSVSDGYGGGAIFCYNASSPTIANCLVQYNEAQTYGGGIHCLDGSSPIIIGCTIKENTARSGGGVCCRNASNATVMDCTVQENRATMPQNACYGGGLEIRDSNLIIGGCAISSNTVLTHSGPGRGGGISWDSTGTLIVVNCDIDGNTVDGDANAYGGGVYASRGTVQMTNCSISENAAISSWTDRYGGGLVCGDTAIITTNCMIVGNSCSGRGAGIYLGYSEGRITNCTIADNGPSEYGAGFYVYHAGARIECCVLWGDEATHGPEMALVGTSDAFVSYSDVEGGWPPIYIEPGSTLDWSEGNIFVDPLFVDAAAGDYHPMAGSPCIDAGCNWAVPPDVADLDNDGDTDEFTPLDLDGEGRFFDDPNTPDTGCGYPAIVHMGAYEFGDTGPQPCFRDFNGDRVIDLADLATLLAHYGETEVCEGNLDCDADVDLEDLAALLAVYRTACD